MRREGQASDQNKIVAVIFFSGSEQSRSVDLDVREGTNCGNVGWNEKESLQTTFERRKGNFACLFGSMCTQHISLTQQEPSLRILKSPLHLLRVLFQMESGVSFHRIIE